MLPGEAHSPFTCERSMPFSAASFFAKGLATTLPLCGGGWAEGAAAGWGGEGAAATCILKEKRHQSGSLDTGSWVHLKTPQWSCPHLRLTLLPRWTSPARGTPLQPNRCHSTVESCQELLGPGMQDLNGREKDDGLAQSPEHPQKASRAAQASFLEVS